MATFEQGAVRLRYDDDGTGFPVLLIAPGGMRSASGVWDVAPWDPRRLADEYRVVAMDQRNAGGSFAPVTADDSWSTYTGDQLALLDHLAIDRCHVVGMCIGGPYIMGLLTAAPERFTSAVLLQPVGIDGNRAELDAMFDQWVELVGGEHPEAGPDDWRSFRRNMWDREFVLTATPEQVAACRTPMLVMMGDDVYHPQSTSRRIAELAPNATLVERWKEGDALDAADGTIRSFLAEHTP